MSTPERIAVIPARGGSKRIPRKNIRPFHGLPLIQWTIRCLVDSGLFGRVVVSTDDDQIAAVAEEAGAEAPFRRSAELSDDHSPTMPVIIDALSSLGLAPAFAAEVCVAYPAAVFVTDEDLGRSLEQLRETKVDVVMTAATNAAPIFRSWRQLNDGSAEMIWPKYANTRSQDLETTYHDAGQFYWWASGTAARLLAGMPVKTGLYLLPRWRVHDIDTEEDWITAERAFRLFSDDDGLGPPSQVGAEDRCP